MISVLIHTPSKNAINQKKIDRTLLWYDHKKKEMKKFSGGKLNFVYTYDDEIGEHRLLPEVEDLVVKESVYVKDRSLIDNWFKIYSNYNHTSVIKQVSNEDGVIFSVPDDEFQNFTYQIERNNMEWEKYE
ncbi:MAG: hypothetical protein ACOC5T_05080 [Elusimicrobiota bacterium]